MSKRDLKKYLFDLNKEQLEEQIMELYDKFKEVKIYYDFAFNPNETKLIKEAKIKVTNEYYPIKGKKAKMRRSIAQKFIKHFVLLGMDAYLIADLMLYTIEIAQSYSSEKEIKQEAFYKSMLTSFQQAIHFMNEKGIISEFKNRVEVVYENTVSQKWFNNYEFQILLEKLDYL
jgi:transcriptional regulator with PAS, ATPase and Fis domain